VRALRLAFVFGVVVAANGCGDLGCGLRPLPAGGLPKDQTVEGGGQIRVTRTGFQKLTAVVPAAINDLAAEGFCVPQGQWGDPSGSWGTGTYYCNRVTGGACGSSRGCDVDMHVDYVNLTVPDTSHLNVAVQIDFHTIVHLDYQVFGADGSCDMNVDGNNIYLNADIVFEIKPADGELGVHLGQINDYDLSGVQFSNCGAISSFGNFARDFIDSWFGQWIVDYFTPTLDDLVQGMLPDPLGVEGVVDIGSLVAGISPGTEAELEARIVPGGYVQLRNNGMSLGLITGINSDQNPATRTPDLDSEPAFCVPPFAAPNFAAPPASLAASSRGTFTLLPAEEFLGMPESADDLVIGVSETTLDLAGHHAVASGALCLGVGTRLIRQLNLGTFGLLVPSLATLGDPDSPVLLVTRPQKPLDMSVGDGTATSPSLSIGFQNLEVDVYVFVEERYTRAFTMSLDMTIGANFVFEPGADGRATIRPELVGLDSSNIGIEVMNNDLVTETRQQLEGVLPTVFDLAIGLLGDGIGPFDVPDFAGFRLTNMRFGHVVTSEDDFLALYATLGASAQMRALGERFPSVGVLADRMEAAPAVAVTAPAVRARAVETPPIDEVRGGAIPTVTLDVPATDAVGRPLEHAWRLGGGGVWRPYATGDALVIQDRAFVWQGRYTIDVRSRVVGDYTTTSAPSSVDVLIDSVAPVITVEGEDVTARDLVSPEDKLVWTRGAADDDGSYTVTVTDEAGNAATERIVPFHGQPGTDGCNCATGGGRSGAPTSGSLVLLALVALRVVRIRRVRRAAKTPTRP
jgi:MYXO-CTERM domain-containing protein